MNTDQIFGQVRPVLKLAGAVMVIIAALKMFGIADGISGGTTEYALVGLGLLHV